LLLPFLLQHHQRRRRWQQLAISFFIATTPQKKTTTHCHCLFFLKHREDKIHKKTIKKNQEKGGSLPSHSYFALSLLALVSTFLLLHFHFKCFFLASYFFQAEENKKTQKKNHKKEKI
jgi:hypothetical protein